MTDKPLDCTCPFCKKRGASIESGTEDTNLSCGACGVRISIDPEKNLIKAFSLVEPMDCCATPTKFPMPDEIFEAHEITRQALKGADDE